ncbi:MAG TPA: cell division FtsA domain-containing protein [Candidatus Paceibacterota bacterium]
MRTALITSIDLGSSHVRVMVCEVKSDGTAPKIISIGEAPSRGMRNGYIINKKEISRSIQEAVNKAQKESSIPIKSCYISLGGIGLTSFSLTASTTLSHRKTITDDDLKVLYGKGKDYVEHYQPNYHIIDSIIRRYLLDQKPILGKPLGLLGEVISASMLYILYPEHHLMDITDVFSSLGIEIHGMLSAPQASARAMLTEKQKVSGCIFVDLGAETLTISGYEEGVLSSLKVYETGSSDITNDIAINLQISLEEAEKAKKGEFEKLLHPLPKDLVSSIIQTRLKSIFETISFHLENHHPNSQFPAGIIIMGGGSQLQKIDQSAKMHLQLPAFVSTIDLQINPRVRVRETSWATAYGTCLLASEYKDALFSISAQDILDTFRIILKKIFRKIAP